MQDSRIEQKIEDIYGFVESCKMQNFSTTKVIVPKNDLYDLLDDLRRDIPDEIKRYRKMLNQRDAILEDAERKAAAILTDAQEQYNALVEEHSIMQQAYQQAEEMVEQASVQADDIITNARRQADEIARGAIYYTTDMMEMAEKLIGKAYESTVNNSRALEASLKGYLDTIRQNKAELLASNQPQETANEPVPQENFSEEYAQESVEEEYEAEYASDEEE